ncbi:MAG: glycosyltransferase family 4 protein [Endomicrobiales bacterium]|nr:glycosyltransferase family 4 protein [Endomicrobiales bacterium]
MKIVYVTNYLPGYHAHAGGAERAINNIAKLLSAKGHDVYFLTLPADVKNGSRSGNDKVYKIKTLESIFPFLKKYIEILKWYVFQYDPLAYRNAKKVLEEVKPDIIHCGNFQFLTFGVLKAARELKIPTIVSIYDYWYFCPLTTLYDYKEEFCRLYHSAKCLPCLPGTMRPVQAVLVSLRKSYFDNLIKLVDEFIVLSNSSLLILKDYGIEQSRISVIHLPNMEEDIKPADFSEEDKSILFMGWLQKRKGLHVLINAIKEVWEKNKVKLDILAQKVKWEKEYEEQIMNRIDHLPPELVTFDVEKKDRKEIENIIRKAYMIVVPEQWENMSPLIVMEGMLYSKPMVASSIGGIPEFIENKREGLLADHNNPHDFAEKILYLLENKNDAINYGIAAQKKAMNLFNKEKITQQLEKEYKRWIQQ